MSLSAIRFRRRKLARAAEVLRLSNAALNDLLVEQAADPDSRLHHDLFNDTVRDDALECAPRFSSR